jgi:carboxypeptidase family protein/TonB-dependent receptor-like protein
MRGRLALFVSAALLIAVPLAAQEQGGAIQGIVKDSSGGVVPGVTIEMRSPSAVGVSTATTDDNGVYRFPALPPGVYELTASLQGFSTKKLPDVQIQLGQLLKVDIILQVATLTEAVVVTGESPIIDTKQNAAAASITKEVIDLIPKGRDFTSVVTMAPGANDESRSGGIQIDGSSGSENRFIIDGMDTTNLRNGTSSRFTSGSFQNSASLVTDFIAEVQVKSSGYAAEYGGSTGGVISAITKSGSNNYHGSAGTYYRNNNLQGDIRGTWRINSFDNRTAEFTYSPDDTFATWSPIGDLGGPIFQNKMWFFAGTTYDRTDNERTAIFRNSPRPYESKTFDFWSSSNNVNWNVTSQLNNKMRLKVAGGNFRGRNRGSGATLLPDGSKFADGTPTDGFTNDAWDTTNGVFDQQKFDDRYKLTGANYWNDQYSGNLDWVLTSKLFVNITSGYWWQDTNTPPEFSGTQLRHSFSSTNIGLLDVPVNLQQANSYSDFKASTRTTRDRYGRAYLNANSTWFKTLKGEHMFKAGVRFERLSNDVESGAQYPTVSLSWNQSKSTADGRVVRGTYGYYTVSRSYTSGAVASNNWSFWVQDSWTVASRVTVNAGVRTENEHVPSYRSEDPGIEFGFGDKIAPRIGFAYDVKGDSRWKVYGSYGKYFDITKLEMPRGSFGAEHSISYYYTLDTFNWPSISCEGPPGSSCPGTYIEQTDFRHPANAIDPKLSAYFGRPQNTIDPNLKPVETGELTFGLDHELGRSLSVGARYTHKWLTRTIEDTGISVPDVGEVFFMANPGFGLGGQVLPPPVPPNPPAQRDYDGLELNLRKRLANSWSLQTSYLYSRLFGNYGGLASSDENGRTSPNVDRYFDGVYLSYDASGTRRPVLGRLGTDRPHQWKTQVTYTAPWGTAVGLDSIVESGTPLQSTLSWRGFNGVYFNGRGDLGRTPVFSQFDLLVQHNFKLMRGHGFNVNVNVSNLFDQKIVTNMNSSPYRDTFNVPGLSSDASNAYFFNGFDVQALAAQIRASGGTMRDQPLFMRPSAFESRRQIRLGVKYTF